MWHSNNIRKESIDKSLGKRPLRKSRYGQNWVTVTRTGTGKKMVRIRHGSESKFYPRSPASSLVFITSIYKLRAKVFLKGMVSLFLLNSVIFLIVLSV